MSRSRTFSSDTNVLIISFTERSYAIVIKTYKFKNCFKEMSHLAVFFFGGRGVGGGVL